MSLQLKEFHSSQLIELQASHKITAYEYARLVPEFARLGKLHLELHLLLQLHEFQGWVHGALWQDMTLEVRHFAAISRLAILGEVRWQESMTTFCKVFTDAEIRFFPLHEAGQARAWITAGLPGTSSPGSP